MSLEISLRAPLIACVSVAVLIAGIPGAVAKGKKKSPSVETLVGQLKDCESLETCPAVKGLKKYGKAVWPKLKVGFTAKDWKTRFWTLGVLSAMKLPAAVPEVGKMLAQDPHFRVRAAAAFALGQLRSKVVTPYLLAAIKDKIGGVRFTVVVAMGRVKDPRTIPALIVTLRDREPEVRQYALAALGDMKAKTAIPRILERLEQDLKPKIRAYAAMALSRIKDPRSVVPLRKRLTEEKNTKALCAAIYALGELQDKKSLPLIRGLAGHKDKEVRDYVADAVKKLSPKTAPAKK